MPDRTNRLYADLAWLWPLWGDPSEYAPYCENAVALMRRYARREVRTLLNLCCGGGKNVFNLKKHFTVTGLDLSPAMLENARKLNPDCRFIQADMRHYTLSEKFDAILIDDGIAYMTTEHDLRAVFTNAYRHLNPGGVMFVGPDDTKETFTQNESHLTPAAPSAKPDHLDVVFIENNYDPDPDDTVFEALMVYIIHENGELRIENDLHHLGLFPLDVWRKTIREVGFEIQEAGYTEDGKDYMEFICIKPIRD
jgi:SAM-dependent methyltransferase